MSVGAPRTVLHVVGAMDRAGAQRRTVELMRRLDPDEFRLVFCALAGEPGACEDEIHALGGEVYHCRPGPSFPLTFIRLLRRLRPSVVHSSVPTSSGAVLGLARVAGVSRRVAHFHTGQDWRRTGPAGERLARVVDRGLIDVGATDLVAVCETAMRGLWRSEWRVDPRCRVIYDGLAVEPLGVAIAARRRALETAPAGVVAPITLVHIGRPGMNANRARAVDVLAALQARGVDGRLQIIGCQETGDTARLLALAARRGVRDRVALLGERDDIPRLLVAASLLLVTSHHESLPSAVLEACAVATPVLSCDLAGVGEISRLLPGITMLPLSAAEEIWADTARALTSLPPSLDDRRAALRHFVRSPFTIENWQRELTAVWSERVSAAPPAR